MRPYPAFGNERITLPWPCCDRNTMSRRILALNAWSLMSPQTGIAAYTSNLARALQSSEEVDVHFFYGLHWSSEIRDAPMRAMDATKKTILSLVPKPYEVAQAIKQWRFNAGVRKFKPTVYHEPNYLSLKFDGPTVITIHDLSHIKYAKTHPAERVRVMNKLLPGCIARAAAIIVDSHFVGNEVIKEFGVPPEKVHPIYLGVSAEFKPRSHQEIAFDLSKYDISPGGYVLAVGTLEPRKNLIQAINAYVGLPESVRKRMPLAIAGMKGWLSGPLEARISQFEARGEVRWLGYVPKEVLPKLYSGAKALIYPSLYEGFGLPALEAMASGIPVITSNRSSLPEVVGDVGLIVDPEDVDDLRLQLHRVFEDHDLVARLGVSGVERAKLFSWAACAAQTLAVYKQVSGIKTV